METLGSSLLFSSTHSLHLSLLLLHNFTVLHLALLLLDALVFLPTLLFRVIARYLIRIDVHYMRDALSFMPEVRRIILIRHRMLLRHQLLKLGILEALLLRTVGLSVIAVG